MWTSTKLALSQGLGGALFSSGVPGPRLRATDLEHSNVDAYYMQHSLHCHTEVQSNKTNTTSQLQFCGCKLNQSVHSSHFRVLLTFRKKQK